MEQRIDFSVPLDGSLLSSIALIESFEMAISHFSLTTPARQSAFLAQAAHESYGFTRLTENLNYSATGLAATWPGRFRGADGQPNALARALHRRPEAIANVVYANRMGNGPEASGDGWRYRGRGLLQITGRAQYQRCGAALGLPLVEQPDLLAQPEPAVLSAAWFWQVNGLNELADAGDFEAITRRINGGLNGLAERRALWVKFREALK
ncbi:glycoside hydrolase family 19 protein [Metapseudomonas otitidis]|uniref:glycoside hydrolase family 19 protein n=1 Tax=Metapseudomonas otitidis TaxID=319939 RepID=UPI00197ECBC9